MPYVYEYDGWSYARLRQQRNRAHFLLEEPYRFVTVLLVTRAAAERGEAAGGVRCRTHDDDQAQQPQPQLFCIDSPCYHAAGPLGEGDVVDVEDVPCVRCPWHNYLVALDDGCEVHVTATRATTHDADNDIEDDSGSSVGSAHTRVQQQQRELIAALPTYPLRPLDVCAPHASSTVVRRGKRVQRTHAVALDEATGVLTITVCDEDDMRARPLPSDRPARSLRDGALCMQIFHIKQEQLDAT